jgi:hypothetical protein
MAVRCSRDDRQRGLFVPKPSGRAGCQGRSVWTARGAAARLAWETLPVAWDARNGGGLATLRRLPWARSTFVLITLEGV